MLERVLHKDDQHQRRQLQFGQLRRNIHVDVHLSGISEAHELNVEVEKLHLARQRNELLAAFVQNVAHHLRQFDDGSLGTFGVDVYEGMNVVERIHEEVGVNLILQILHLLFEVALVDNLLALSVALRHEVELHAEIHAHKQQSAEESHQLARSKHRQRVDRLKVKRLAAHRVLRTAVASVAKPHSRHALVSQRVGFPLRLHACLVLAFVHRSVEVGYEHARQQY